MHLSGASSSSLCQLPRQEQCPGSAFQWPPLAATLPTVSSCHHTHKPRSMFPTCWCLATASRGAHPATLRRSCLVRSPSLPFWQSHRRSEPAAQEPHSADSNASTYSHAHEDAEDVSGQQAHPAAKKVCQEQSPLMGPAAPPAQPPLASTTQQASSSQGEPQALPLAQTSTEVSADASAASGGSNAVIYLRPCTCKGPRRRVQTAAHSSN